MPGTIKLNDISNIPSQKDLLNTSDTFGTVPPSAFRELSDATIYEPQRNNHFEFVADFSQDDLDKLLKWNKATDATTGGQDDPYLYNVEDILRVSLDTAFIPEIGINTLQVKRGNSEKVFAGSPNFNHSGTLNFVDYIGARTYDVALAWFQLVYNMKTDKVGLAQDYKRTAHIFQYTPTWQLVRAWKLYGVFPTSVKPAGNITYDGQSDKMKVEMVLSYDNFEIDYETMNSKINTASAR